MSHLFLLKLKNLNLITSMMEEKYRRYYENNPNDGYCLSLIDPKIEKKS